MRKQKRLIRCLRSEAGSEVAQAAGVALAAIFLIAALLNIVPMLKSSVEHAYACLVASLNGGGSCGGGATAGGPPPNQPAPDNSAPSPGFPPGSRGLTPDEKAQAQALFGQDAIDWDKVVVSTNGINGQGRPWTYGNTVFFPPNEPIDKAVLMHELTHVNQFQHRGWVYMAEAAVLQAQYEVHKKAPWLADNPYKYGEDAGLRQARQEGKHFKDFNVEQQGQIVEDYYNHKAKGEDTSAYEPFIADLRRGEIAP